MRFRLPRNQSVFISAAVVLALSLVAGAAQKAAPKTKSDSQTPTMSGGAPQEKKIVRKRRRAKPAPPMAKGPQGCIDRLIEIASKDPLPSYEGQPEKLINGGLLWNSPDS